MPFIDMHCDTVLEMINKGIPLYDNNLDVSIKKLSGSGVMCQFFALFVKLTDYPEPGAAFERARDMYDVFRREVEANSQYIEQVRTAAELDSAVERGKIAALLTVEEGGVCGGSLERLEELYDMGVRAITLTWNYENEIGYPNSDNIVTMDKGLKPFGIEFVENMHRLGMIVDVSHLSDGGFWDVVRHSRKPFVATHSNARAVRGFRRNLNDEQLKALARAGGVTGINFYSHFLGENGTGSVEQMIEHIRHIKRVAGIDTVALGSDFDGFAGKSGIRRADELPKLTDALEAAGFSAREIEKICWKNALRVIHDTL